MLPNSIKTRLFHYNQRLIPWFRIINFLTHYAIPLIWHNNTHRWFDGLRIATFLVVHHWHHLTLEPLFIEFCLDLDFFRGHVFFFYHAARVLWWNLGWVEMYLWVVLNGTLVIVMYFVELVVMDHDGLLLLFLVVQIWANILDRFMFFITLSWCKNILIDSLLWFHLNRNQLLPIFWLLIGSSILFIFYGKYLFNCLTLRLHRYIYCIKTFRLANGILFFSFFIFL